MEKHNIELTSPEIAGLWKYYLQNTAVLCVIRHFLLHIQDEEIKPLLEAQEKLLMDYNDRTKKIFEEEHFPIPEGFSDKDLNSSAPALYTDLYGLSFVYRFNQMCLSDYATTATKVARKDVVDCMYYFMETTAALYRKSLDLMLSKGVYDRPPKMNYPHKVEFVEKQESILNIWFGERRPLNAFELGEIFYIIERNYIGLLLIMGFIQVMKDKEIKEFLIEGKELAEKQIDVFNKILIEEAHLGNIPVSMEVTDSSISPFSDRLIMFMVASTITTGIYLAAYAVAVPTRKDIAAHYGTIIMDIIKYGTQGQKLMIERGWMEQPPQAFDRVKAMKSE